MNKIKIMKQLCIITLLFLSIVGYSQVIVPLENKHDHMEANGGAVPINTYYQDVNNVLTAYVGTWKGVSPDNEYNYTITFSIDNKVNALDHFYEDELVVDYIIRDVNGIIIDKTERGIADRNYLSASGLSLEATSYIFYYAGKEQLCGQNGDFFVTPVNTTTLRIWVTPPNSDFINVPEMCPNGRAPQLFPLKSIPLTKQ